ncbi:MAG: hypothetical protein A3G80_10890 [Betaproteobacteria bacterium RIFCSPLOWO2_12_FULL_62_13b]|nr:MAG: hypothetical protein A3G80_10890 [Betaproteobacteria bacterium RIFCSPLOWO2_12_FULL_62_13b]
MGKQLIVRANWDEKAKVWVATSDDVRGLVTEANTMDALVKKLMVMVPELLDANGYVDGDEVPFEVCTHVKAKAVKPKSVSLRRVA